MPKNSIRTLILLAFIGLGVYLYREQDRFNATETGRNVMIQAQLLLGLVFSYVLGAIARTIGGWINRSRGTPPTGTWGDIKAMTVLIVLVLAAVPQFIDLPTKLPDVFEQIALGLMLFYYGSR